MRGPKGVEVGNDDVVPGGVAHRERDDVGSRVIGRVYIIRFSFGGDRCLRLQTTAHGDQQEHCTDHEHRRSLPERSVLRLRHIALPQQGQ